MRFIQGIEKMKVLIFLTLNFLALSTYSLELTIVDDSICLKRGRSNNIWRCDQLEVTLPTKSLKSYIPVEASINVTKGVFCKTSFPIYLDVYGGDEQLQTLNAFSVNQIYYDQSSFSSFSVAVNAPHSNIASFDERCKIFADVQTDIVNLPKLTGNLIELKASTEHELGLINSLISKQLLIIDLASAIEVYASVLSLAEQRLADFNDINSILEEMCSGESNCSWGDQITLILDNNLDIDFQSQLTLFLLAQELDKLKPSDCNDDNCIASLITPDIRTLFEDIASRTASKDDSTAELQSFQSQKMTLENSLIDYEATANEYHIDWSTL